MEQEQHFRLLQRARLKALLRSTLWLTGIGITLYYWVAMVYATHTIFKVRRNYAVILEDLSGERRVVEEVGWHARLPFFSRLEQEVPLMNQELLLGSSQEPRRIMSKGNVALWTSAMLTFRITDLRRWGIENREPQKLLQTDYDGIVMDIMQARTVDELVSDRERIKEEIFLDLKRRPINAGGPTLEQKYGIEVISFVLRETRYGDKLAEASEEKKRRELLPRRRTTPLTSKRAGPANSTPPTANRSPISAAPSTSGRKGRGTSSTTLTSRSGQRPTKRTSRGRIPSSCTTAAPPRR